MNKQTETITQYSGDIPGDASNHCWPISFDFTDGYIGISQQAEQLERVLLSPRQFDELVEHIEYWRRKRRTARSHRK